MKDVIKVSANGSNPSHAQPNVLKNLTRVLLTYRWTWISTTAIVVLAVAVAVFTLKPRYTAECMVLIEPGKMNITDFKDVYDPTMTQGGAGDARREFTETQYHMMLSAPVLEKVFLRFGFGDHPMFCNTADPLKAFKARFRVEPIRRTRLARVLFTWEDPELAARALHYLVKSYIEEYRRRRLGVTADGLAALKTKGDDLRPRVEKQAQALQQFIADQNMVSLEENQDIVKERLKEISTNLTRVESARIQLESRYESIRVALTGQRALDDLPEVNSDPVIRDLKLELVKVVQEINNFGDRFGANHPEMRRMSARRDVLKGRLTEEIEGILARAEADLDRVRRQEQELKRSLADQEKKVMAQSRMAVQYNMLRDGYESSNESYKTIIKRIEEIEIASAAGTKEDNVFEIAEPKVPTTPSFPRKLQSLILAMLVGLILGVGLSFLLHALDGSVKTVDDVEKELGIPVLGFVPVVDRNEVGEGVVELYGLEHPRGPFAEAFRSLHTSMALARAGAPLRRLLVTSPSPGEGKDLISVNLGISLARSGRRVLIVDCDMRRPRQHKIFGVSASPGLSNLLAGEPVENPVSRTLATQVPGLSLLPSGPVPPNPVELISSPRMTELLDALGSHFDVLVVNSPPLMAVSDSVILSGMVEGTVVVVRAFSTRLEDARRALEMLHRADASLLGVALNLVDVPRYAGGYYGYGGYGYGRYGYYAYLSHDADTHDADTPGTDDSRPSPTRSRRKPRIRLKDGQPETSGALFES